LELEFSDGDLDGFIDAVIDEFQEPLKLAVNFFSSGISCDPQRATKVA